MVDMKDLDLVIEGTLCCTDEVVVAELKSRLNGGYGCHIDGANIKIYKDIS